MNKVETAQDLMNYFDALMRAHEAKDVLGQVQKRKAVVRAQAMVVHYYESLLFASIGNPASSELAAMRVAALGNGVCGGDALKIDHKGNTFVPKSFLEDHAGAREIYDHIGSIFKGLAGKFEPKFVLGNKESIHVGMVDRVLPGSRSGRYDYWPVLLDATGKEGSPAASIVREELAGIYIDDIVASMLPADFAKRDRGRDVVATFGSCFAQNLATALIESDIRCQTFRIDETVNTPRANRLLLEYLLLGREEDTDFFSKTIEPAKAAELRGLITQVAVVVLTVGVSPVVEWRDSGKLCITTGSYRQLFDQGEVVQRFTSVEENRDHLVAIVTLLRSINPALEIFITLSPVPLIGVADGSSVLSRDLLSKSTLRVAIEEAARLVSFHYWPSFELVKWLAPHAPTSMGYQAYGADDKNTRHVSRWLVKIITDKFIDYVFVPEQAVE